MLLFKKTSLVVFRKVLQFVFKKLSLLPAAWRLQLDVEDSKSKKTKWNKEITIHKQFHPKSIYRTERHQFHFVFYLVFMSCITTSREFIYPAILKDSLKP